LDRGAGGGSAWRSADRTPPATTGVVAAARSGWLMALARVAAAAAAANAAAAAAASAASAVSASISGRSPIPRR